mmetsp:Transcript_4784/g.10272  ORF Transcript_4784/g.10272 Transcript_4784/m.10272 type:complete len:458 (+) Transcript_4784:555-1928(+)
MSICHKRYPHASRIAARAAKSNNPFGGMAKNTRRYLVVLMVAALLSAVYVYHGASGTHSDSNQEAPRDVDGTAAISPPGHLISTTLPNAADTSARAGQSIGGKREDVGKARNGTGGIVYFVPQVGKSGSSTLRNMFNARGEAYGKPRMDDPEVFREIRRKCGGTEGDEGPTYDGNRTAAPYYPFVKQGVKFSQFPYYWILRGGKLAWKNDTECLDHVIASAWKFWRGIVETRSSPVEGGGHWHPKPAIQASVPCPPSSGSATGTTAVECRRLVQMRHPLTWIESSFGYFCEGCKDAKKFCGKVVDARCGPRHREKGDHETIQSWARKFGNAFTRILHGDERLLAGGTWDGGMSPDGWTHRDALELPRHVDETLRTLREGGHCVVALEDPRRLSRIEACLGDRPGFYARELGYTEERANNAREERTRLDPNVTAELREILAADISLYNGLFPFLAVDV